MNTGVIIALKQSLCKKKNHFSRKKVVLMTYGNPIFVVPHGAKPPADDANAI